MTYLAALLIAAAPVPKEPAAKPPTAEQVAASLADRYPVVRTRLAGQFVFTPGTAVVELTTPALVRSDPGLRLFRTSLDSGYHEYQKVETLVAAWTVSGQLKTVQCLSPVFSSESAEFVGRLRGLRAKTPEEQTALAAEVCEAFAGITYKGRIKAGQRKGDTYSAELWHDDRLWRRIGMSFDVKGAVSELKLINPSSKE